MWLILGLGVGPEHVTNARTVCQKASGTVLSPGGPRFLGSHGVRYARLSIRAGVWHTSSLSSQCCSCGGYEEGQGRSQTSELRTLCLRPLHLTLPWWRRSYYYGWQIGPMISTSYFQSHQSALILHTGKKFEARPHIPYQRMCRRDRSRQVWHGRKHLLAPPRVPILD